MPGPSPQLLGYEIRRQLGAGGMGIVYLAQDLTLGRSVAIKVLSGEVASDHARIRRFEQEARAASALSHPNVCVVHALGETAAGQPFIAMEYVEGEDAASPAADAPAYPEDGAGHRDSDCRRGGRGARDRDRA